MRILPALLLGSTFSLAVALGGCRSAGTTSEKSDPTPTTAAAREAAPHAKLGTDPGGVGAGTSLAPHGKNQLASFAGGCFWGVEDVFRQVPGVVSTAVGYTGGKTDHPSYEQVCTHTTGHAEAVVVEFDPSKVSYDDLLRIFFSNHNPTTLNRQGPDIGDQYRSEVFTFSEVQAEAARKQIAETEKKLGKKVVTRVTPLGSFWKAEEYHQQYDEKTGTHSCPSPIGVPKGA